MIKVAIVYWSGTGNTEKMASFVEEGAKTSGAEVILFNCSDFDVSTVSNYDALAFGCPSMGAEVLEDDFQEMWDKVENSLKDKKIALFGSYDWGDGEWMRNWEARCKEIGVNLVCDFVIANLTPDEDAKEDCFALGASLAH